MQDPTSAKKHRPSLWLILLTGILGLAGLGLARMRSERRAETPPPVVPADEKAPPVVRPKAVRSLLWKAPGQPWVALRG